MKKSLLALIFSTTFILSACDDKANVQKLSDAEKTVTHLESVLKQSQEELKNVQSELATLKPKYEHLLKKQPSFPALNVQIERFFDKSEEVKHEKDPKENIESDRESTNISISGTLPNTGVAWLDQLLMREIYKINVSEEEAKKVPSNISKAQLVEQFEQLYNEMKAEAKEYKSIGLSMNIHTFYVGQRNNIATFQLNWDTYNGGAHGMYHTYYVNIDVNKKSIITLNDLISPQDQKKVEDRLWEEYKFVHLDENGKFDEFTSREDFYIAEDFYFKEGGIVFSYPPYALSYFAKGTMELNLYDNQYLNPAYKLGEKDGIYPEKE